MICSKCGFEFSGNVCPKCDSPAILVNSSDYERRKKEWEQREKLQADKEKKKKQEQDNLRQLVKDVTIVSDEALKSLRKKKRMLALGLLAVVVLILLGVGIRGIAHSESRHLYVSDGKMIYKDAHFDSAYCSEEEIAYAFDKRTGYKITFPEGIDKKSVIATMSSPNGKYFAAVTLFMEKTYNGNSGVAEDDLVIGESDSAAINGNAYGEGSYCVYVWQKGAKVIKETDDFGQSESQTNILYVSNEGKVVYSKTSYLNEGLINELSIYAGNDKIVTNPISYFINPATESVVAIDADKNLNITDLKSMQTKRIASRVNCAYAQADDLGYFVYSTEDYEYICHDISTSVDEFLFSTREAMQKVFYGSDTGRAFGLAGVNLWQFDGIPSNKDEKKNDSGKRESKQIDTGVLSTSLLYFYKDNELVYANGEGNLKLVCYAKKGKWNEKSLRQGVFGSITKLEGTDDGFYYDVDGQYFYRKSVKADEKEAKTSQIAVYDGKLYYILDGNLYSDSSEKAINIMKVTHFWIGNISVKN